ncbi:IS110 family transposase [Desulfomarina profundi]|uniref:IS110 family transposase n=1 Tax=Desulfomarina profundi TaxID=2772557 RepID=A0A8D5JHS9_9BACT|nr:IS110 family transposase [Desulfomarina profundi]BCL59350.1 IS110 family transposase [Desulfomarina profundi]BCL60692.1 IS110 family transposase [Desulfomarina profundi]BCL61864.1 IS110 family transposase [Desulfomarina profundi]BCL62112.1 IS110 family transposase [Desulfomarina profundi]
MNSITIGMDLGDKTNFVCIVGDRGTILLSKSIDNNVESIRKFFRKYKRTTVAIEAGTHSPWMSRLLSSMGCNVLVGNPRKLRAIWESDCKTDQRDAEMLARIARFDPNLLYPIQHKGEQVQADLALLHSRDLLVRTRSSQINHVRGIVKSFGERLPSCSTECFHKKAISHIPQQLQLGLGPVLILIAQLNEQIKALDKEIESISSERYPETELLRRVKGVGPLTALAFVLTVEDPGRFGKSRQIGPYLGLTPRRDQSGETDKQLRITKAGSPFLRKLLINSAQYILGPFGEDCNLQRFGLRLASRGGKNARRKAVVAVGRKLAILLHRLWKYGEIYDPVYKRNVLSRRKAA